MWQAKLVKTQESPEWPERSEWLYSPETPEAPRSHASPKSPEGPISTLSPQEYYGCVSPVSATDSLLPQAYFGRVNFHLAPPLKSSIESPGHPALPSPTFQWTPVSVFRNMKLQRVSLQ